MNKLVKSLLVAAAFSLSAGASVAYAQEEAKSLDQLLEMVKQNRAASQRINAEREAEFTSARADKQALLTNAKRQLANEKSRGERLQREFAENEVSLANKEEELKNAMGTLGEIVGVARGAASDTIGRIATSIVSAQFPGREVVLESIAEAREVPTIAELEELWLAWLTEMRESGRVVKFNADVAVSGSTANLEVTRVGVFNLIADSKYFRYNDSVGEIQELGRQPDGHVTSAAGKFEQTESGYAPLYIDPARGQILNLAIQKATLSERYHQGGTVGYVITAVLIIGILIAIYKFITLTAEAGKMRSQLKNIENPSSNNALGRILTVYKENQAVDVETLEMKLDEAILRETPRIDSGVNIIKVFAAIAPLLGLLGTVVGMIGTFQSITLFGTGDPKIMAGDISMALVTTAQGLIAAIPLILVHSVVAARAKSIVQVLDEQATGIVAAHAEKKG